MEKYRGGGILISYLTNLFFLLNIFLYFLSSNSNCLAVQTNSDPNLGADAKNTCTRLSTLNLLLNMGRIIRAKHFSGLPTYSYSLVRLCFKPGPSMGYDLVSIWPITIHDFQRRDSLCSNAKLFGEQGIYRGPDCTLQSHPGALPSITEYYDYQIVTNNIE